MSAYMTRDMQPFDICFRFTWHSFAVLQAHQHGQDGLDDTTVTVVAACTSQIDVLVDMPEDASICQHI